MRHDPLPLRRALVRAAAIVLSAAALAGCLKMKDRTRIYPDGSGKVVLSMSMKKDTLELIETMGAKAGKDGPKSPLDFTPDRLQKDFQGFVAFSDSVRSEKDEWVTVSVTGYFEDANKVRMAGSGDEKDPQVLASFSFRKEGAGYVVENASTMSKKMKETADKAGGGATAEPQTDEQKQQAEMAKAMMKSMMGGFEYATELEMPGAITTCEGYRKFEGSTASFSFSIDEILDDKKRADFVAEMEKQKGKSQRVVCGASTVKDEDIKAFKAEMAAAKVSWEKRLAEAKAAAGAGAPAAPPAPGATDPVQPPPAPK